MNGIDMLSRVPRFAATRRRADEYARSAGLDVL
jgi:hypothetical protein